MSPRLLSMFLALAIAAPASAQEARATVVPTSPNEIPGDMPPSEPRPLAELCAEAARSQWAEDAGASGELVCALERAPHAGVFLLRIRHTRGEALFVAFASGRGYALAGQLEALSWAPELRGQGGSALVRLERRAIRGWPVLTFETTTWREELGARTEARHLTVCLHRRADLETLGCVLRVPLEVRGDDAHAAAEAVLSADGTLSLAIRAGSWAQLFDASSRLAGAWPRGISAHLPGEPPHAARLPDVLTDPLELPFLFVDQWRPAGAPWPQPLARAEAEVADPTPPEDRRAYLANASPGSLAAVCALAVPMMADPSEGAGCSLFATSEPELLLMWAVNMWSEDAFLVVRQGRGYRLVAHVGALIRGATESGATRVRTVHRRSLGSAEVLAIETETVFENRELGEPATLGFEARFLTVCTHEPDRIETLRCGARIPLSVRHYVLDMREVLTPSPGNYPFFWREITSAHHEAIAILRPDGSVRVRMRRGSWSALGCEAHHNALPIAVDPAEAEPIVPFFATNQRRPCTAR